MEVLQLLRDATVRGQVVKVDGDDLVFENGQRVGKKTPTAFMMKGKRETYALDSLWFLLLNKEQSTRAYSTECMKEGIERVQILDKKAVVDFLTGKTEEVPRLPGDVAPKTAADASAVDQEADRKGASLQKPDTESKRDGADRKDSIRNLVLAAMDREKDQRTRDGVLLMKGRSFKYLLDVLNKYLRKKEEERRIEAAKAEAVIDPRGDRYRVDNDRFYRERMGKEFTELGIDPSGTFKKTPGDKRAPRPPSSSTNVRLPSHHNDRGHPSGMSDVTNMAGREQMVKRPRPSGSQTPIIIAPGARDSSALVTIANLPILLKDKTFQSAREVLKQGNAALSQQVKVPRVSPRTGQSVDYLVVSNVRQLSAGDWDRVVAIICQGAEWQFKGFPAHIGSTPQQVLTKLQGFYFYFAGDRIDNPVKSWKVKFIPIDRNRRHEDVKVANEFWHVLDDFVKLHRAYLRW